ncbi:MAG: helix-turn-helix domain-containing protein [Actinomycetia bacterium]|nr:helix-turn-helix domain-containing protein [Actinomycetes bacterium]MCP4963276.1 helix-turn-helix domain-containing protein [Actinomycetes bacterium]
MVEPSIRSSTPARSGVLPRAFVLLQTVVGADAPIGVRELARQTGIARSTVARLGAQLVELDMLGRLDDGRLTPGPGLAALTPGAERIETLVARLRPLLSELVGTFGESAAVAVDDGDAVLYVAHEAAAGAIQVASVEQERHPFHLVAPGVCMMATWEEDRLAEYQSSDLEAATAHSVISPPDLAERLNRVRRDGFAWAIEELHLDINGVATLVTHDGSTAVSVGLYGPSFRLSPQLTPHVGERLGELVSTRIGGPAS